MLLLQLPLAYYFYHLRILKVKHCLNETCRRMLAQALVISRLDYCNSALFHFCSSTPRSSNTRSYSQRPHRPQTATTALAFPCPCRLQNLPSNVSYPFWDLSVKHGIH